MSSKINLQTCEYARKSSIFQDNQLIYYKHPEKVCLYDREINFGNCYRKTKEIHGCFTNMSDSVL